MTLVGEQSGLLDLLADVELKKLDHTSKLLRARREIHRALGNDLPPVYLSSTSSSGESVSAEELVSQIGSGRKARYVFPAIKFKPKGPLWEDEPPDGLCVRFYVENGQRQPNIEMKVRDRPRYALLESGIYVQKKEEEILVVREDYLE